MEKNDSKFNLGIVVVILFLFIGVYAISIVGGLVPNNDRASYVSTTSINSTGSYFNSTLNASHRLMVNPIATIVGVEATKTLTTVIENTNTSVSFNISVYLNGAYLGKFLASNNTNTSNVFSNVSFTGNAINSITYEVG